MVARTAAVFFDVDFTLIQPGPRFQASGYHASCARHGIVVDVSRFDQAVSAASDRPISIAGGASCARQAIAAGIVDEIDLQLSPELLGSGERLFDGFAPGRPAMELVRVLEAPGVAHLRYRVLR